MDKAQLTAAQRAMSERTTIDGKPLSFADSTRMVEEEFDQSGFGDMVEEMTRATNIEIVVRKLTDVGLMRWACELTMRDGKKSNMTLADMYKCEHSPMYTQWFKVTIWDIPAFAAKQLARHDKHGTVHFITTGREDRGAPVDLGRWASVNHGVMVNAKSLVDMARSRLCNQAHETTKEIMEAIKQAVASVDPDLAKRMVPECVYRQGCHELKPCGHQVWRH